MSSLSLRPGDSLTIPWMAWSVGFIRSVSSTDATQATRRLTPFLVGLTPTDHVSLLWTHSFAKILSDTETAKLILPFHQVRVASAREIEPTGALAGGEPAVWAEVFPGNSTSMNYATRS